MSILIQKDTLTKEMIDVIQTQLHIKSEKNKYIKKKFKAEVEKEITCFIEFDHYIKLPFIFCMNLTKVNNDSFMRDKIGMEFIGEMREAQVPYLETAIDHLSKKRTCILNTRPGSGKTTIATNLSCIISRPTVVLIRSRTLYKQWKKTYLDRTNCRVWCVGEDKVIPDGIHVIICLWKRVFQIKEEIRNCVNTILIDEAHMFCNQEGVNAILSFPCATYIIAMTATFERMDGKHKIMEFFVGKEMVAKNQIVPFKLTEVKTGCIGERVIKNDMVVWHTLNKSILYNPYRNQQAVELLIRLVEIGRKILVYTTEVDHVLLLHSMLKGAGLQSCDWFSGDKTGYKNSSVLVSNPQKSGTGFDEEMFCDDFEDDPRRIDTVMLLGSMKDIALLYQMCGRAMRSNDPWVIDFSDNDETLKRQFSARNWWYKRNGAIPCKFPWEEEFKSILTEEEWANL